MPRESHYMEESCELFIHSDLVISRTSQLLYDALCDKFNQSGKKPLGHFNIRYFILSFAQAIAISENLQETKLAISREEHALVRAINPPSSEQLASLGNHYLFRSKIAQSYIALVSEHSQEAGDEFDINYALTTACSAIDAETYGSIFSEKATEKNDDFDHEYWLSCFDIET